MTSDEFTAKAAVIVRHALPANMIPQVYKNALVDAIADGLAFYFVEGQFAENHRLKLLSEGLWAKSWLMGDIGHE